MGTTPTNDDPNPDVPTVVSSDSDADQEVPRPPVSLADRFPGWLKAVVVVLPVLAFIVSGISLCVSVWSARFAMGYTRLHEDHDVVAKVLGVSALTKGLSQIETNGALTVDIALINRGNQKEIIREAFLCYSDNKDFRTRGRIWERPSPALNAQLDKGEKRVLHLLSAFSSVNTGKRMWLGVGVRAIAPNADDIEIVWPVCEIDLAPDGSGSWFSYNKAETPRIQIISNKRLAHQRLAPDGF